MRITIATPLYPPDIAEPAPYVKELIKRLSAEHNISVVIYGRLPEKIPGVSFICVDKRLPLPLRLLHFSFTLLKETLRADILYTENGASVELPAGLVTFFTHKPLIIHVGDKAAKKKIEENTWLKRINSFAMKQAQHVIEKTPRSKPEILPFELEPKTELEAYETSWNIYIKELENIFKHA